MGGIESAQRAGHPAPARGLIDLMERREVDGTVSEGEIKEDDPSRDNVRSGRYRRAVD